MYNHFRAKLECYRGCILWPGMFYKMCRIAIWRLYFFAPVQWWTSKEPRNPSLPGCMEWHQVLQQENKIGHKTRKSMFHSLDLNGISHLRFARTLTSLQMISSQVESFPSH